MIVWQGRGDLLTQTDHVQLCPINAVGTMGRGLARTMAVRYPGLEAVYRELYHPYQNPLSLEDRARVLTVVESPDHPSVLLFCTKYHWRDPSPMLLVEDNLRQLAERWEALGIARLAMPVVGTGLGQLPVVAVVDRITHYLGESHPLPVRLYMGP